jgi:5,10-methylenetetrahydromethanopterin reductase
VTAAPHFGVGLVGQWPMREITRLARRIEEMGFDDLWIPDERFERDVFVSLAVAAQHTDRVALSTCVTDPFIRHPMLTAVAVASLDELSGGRARVALGAGLSGFAQLGIERRRPATAIREAVRVMRGAWAGESVTYDGELIRCADAQLAFRSRADIPVYIAGRGRAVLRAAGAVGDGVMVGTFASERMLAPALAAVDEGLAQAGRTRADVDLVSWIYVSIADDPELALRAVRRPVAVALWGSRDILGELGIEIPAKLARLMDSGTYALSGPVLDEAAALVPLELAAHMSVSGTPSDVEERLQALMSLGINGFAAWLLPAEGRSYDDTLAEFGDVARSLSAAPAGLRRPV